MSEYVEGTVERITKKRTNNGGTVYNVCINTGQDDEWFGHGFATPEFNEGDEIGFDIEYKGDYVNINPDTVEVLKAGEPPRRGGQRNSRGSIRKDTPKRGGGGGARGGKPSSGGGKGAGSKDTMSKEEWAQKDKMIQLQAAMNTAIALVSSAVANDLVALPTKKADKYDAYVALINEEASRLHKQYLEEVYGAPKREARSRRGQDEEPPFDPDEPDFDDDIPM